MIASIVDVVRSVRPLWVLILDEFCLESLRKRQLQKERDRTRLGLHQSMFELGGGSAFEQQ
jgi:hypothetical protein